MSAFEQRQQQYFTQELNRALPSQTVDTTTLELALGEIDPTTQGYTKGFLSDFGVHGSAIKRDAECRAIPYPGPAMRAPDARTGCGWVFSQNPAVPSTGAYGTRRGPMDPQLVAGSSRWIWDPEEAARMEGHTLSARFRTCPDIQFSPNPNIGWCPSTGRALMTDGKGNPAYPQMAGGDCPDTVIMNAANCPKPPTAQKGSGLTDICTPSNGKLSPACLQSLSSWSCSSNGLLATTLGSGYAGTSDTFNSVNNYLLQRGFTLHSGILQDGRLSVQDALSSVNGLRSMANSGDGTRASGAAMNMCFGTPFDPCALKPSDKGPYDAQCITQKAFSMGYAPTGTLLPSKIGMGYWNNAPTWQNVIEYLTWWKQVADRGPSFTGDLKLQIAAIQHVYGIRVNEPAICPR